MCGIVGAVAQRDIAEILLEGLRRLEYLAMTTPPHMTSYSGRQPTSNQKHEQMTSSSNHLITP